MSTQPDTQNVRKELGELGWQQVAADQLLGEDILAISARMLGNRLGYGEVPKARWTAEWQLVQDNANGTRRLRYASDAPTQRFFLRHPNGAGLVEVTIQSLPKFASVICEITVSEALANESLSIVATQQLSANEPPIVFSRDQQLSEEPNSKRVGATYYNPKRIPDLIDTSFPFVGTIRVSNSLRR